jgi:hypothetical protein
MLGANLPDGRGIRVMSDGFFTAPPPGFRTGENAWFGVSDVGPPPRGLELLGRGKPFPLDEFTGRVFGKTVPVGPIVATPDQRRLSKAPADYSACRRAFISV